MTVGHTCNYKSVASSMNTVSKMYGKSNNEATHMHGMIYSYICVQTASRLTIAYDLAIAILYKVRSLGTCIHKISED